MATTFVDVLLQVRDELGADVLNGGFIQTDAAGTTTPLVTYQDLAGATPNTNPVELDDTGMAQIRQTDGVAYKWRVYDADMNLLWTRDNITVGTGTSDTDARYRIHFSYAGTPGDAGFIGGHVFLDTGVLPVDFEDAAGKVGTNPASSYVITAKFNGATVGTITIGTGGSYTFATTSHVTIPFTPGDDLAFYGPATAGTAANLRWSLAGTVE